MSSLVIVSPPRHLASSATVAGMDRMLTPDPKEAFAFPNDSASRILYIDFGAPVTVDSIYVGYHTAQGGQIFIVQKTDTLGGPSTGNVTGNMPLAPIGAGSPFHSFVKVSPVTSRYFAITFNAGTTGAFTAGVVAMGQAFQPTYGHEYGSGRLVTDTGSAERLFGGGFGINEGTRARGWQWTLGDLTDAEVNTLYRMAVDRGTTRSVIVVEDPDNTDGLNERIHWGLFSKLDPYERFAPGATRWGLRIDDWA